MHVLDKILYYKFNKCRQIKNIMQQFRIMPAYVVLNVTHITVNGYSSSIVSCKRKSAVEFCITVDPFLVDTSNTDCRLFNLQQQ
jgi:hypothetical protein